jgi:5'-methylthioadenosine phosphorylase
MPAERTCKCGSALAHAMITDRTLVPLTTLQKLEPIVGKYFV